jgi:acetate kinase
MEKLHVKQARAHVLTINGGSSSIKFALFDLDHTLQRILAGSIERIGLPDATFEVKGSTKADSFNRSVTAPNHIAAVGVLMDWIEQQFQRGELTAVGHRVVHGGPKYSEPQLITTEMVEELHQLQPFDPEHLPEEILLTEAFHRRFPDLVQVACFDTAFHHNLPRVAQLFPIPRFYEAQGVRRYGFHGLSYAPPGIITGSNTFTVKDIRLLFIKSNYCTSSQAEGINVKLLVGRSFVWHIA